MTYDLVRPPVSLDFRNRSNAELQRYRDWFHSALPGRIAQLASAVAESPGFEGWRPDSSVDSLTPLGEWFRGQVETRAKTEAERAADVSSLRFPIDLPGDELTDRTFSLAVDIGMYFGEVVVTNLQGTRWDQPLKNPNFVDHGQPVIMGFGTVPLNPIRIAVTLAYAFAAREQSGDRLRSLFDVWSKKRK